MQDFKLLTPRGTPPCEESARDWLAMAFAAHSVLREVQCCKGLPAGGSCRKAVQQGRLQSRSDRNVPSIMQRSSRKRRNVKLCSSSNDMASNENEFDLSQ